MKKTSQTNKKEKYREVCYDCKKEVISVYGKSIKDKKVKYVCWACFNDDEE